MRRAMYFPQLGPPGVKKCKRRQPRAASLGAGAALLWASGAWAQTTPPAAPAAPAPATSNSTMLFGDLGGLRPFLAKYGITLTLQEQSEVLGNVTGGTRQGFEYDGLTTATVQMDTQAAFGWQGGQFNVSALQIHGRDLSADNLLTLQLASGIEADPATRLWELWYQQKFFNDKVDVRFGQMSIDQEFIITQNGSYFINTSFGFPQLPATDLPGGAPQYPLSGLGVRVAAHPSDTVTILAAVLNGSPDYRNVGSPQQQNPSGVSFPTNGGVLAIAELQYTTPTSAGKSDPQPLPGTYKIGGWYDSESVADVLFDGPGLPLANPASEGIPLTHPGDFGLYAVADQMIYRWSDDPDRNISVFARPVVAPQQDRNYLVFNLQAGVTAHGLIKGRNDDVFGVGVTYAQVSERVTAQDQLRATLNPGAFIPVRHNETVVEATYQYQATPWLKIQPDFQFVFNPGAGIANPNDPTEKVKDEAVLGVRATIAF